MSYTQTDWRALCGELAHEVQQYAMDRDDEFPECLDRASAALAQPEPEVAGPAQDELWELWLRLDRELPDRPAAVAAFWEHAQVEARSRFGRPAPAPAGEVAELVAWLRQRFPSVAHIPGSDYHLANRAADMLEHRDLSLPDCERNLDSILSPSGGYEMDADAALRDGAQLVNGEWWAPVFGCDSLELTLCRIRERMERQAAPVPVAVSERLPGGEERDSDECCWWFHPETDDTLPVWVLGFGDDEWEIEKPPSPTHWLPGWFLPLPSGEVQP